MKKHFLTIVWFILFCVSIYLSYKYGNEFYKTISSEGLKQSIRLVIYMFAAGFALAGLIFEIIYTNTSSSLDAYKRELEKESIDKTEGSERIKVLEAKIQVLEKALDEAIKK